MGEPVSAQILSWIQAVGFATGAAAAAATVIWLGELPDGVGMYTGIAAIAFVSGLFLWRKMIGTARPAISSAIGVGLAASGVVFIAMGVGVVISLGLPGVIELIVMPITVGWKLVLLEMAWGLVWAGMLAASPGASPTSNGLSRDTPD